MDTLKTLLEEEKRLKELLDEEKKKINDHLEKRRAEILSEIKEYEEELKKNLDEHIRQIEEFERNYFEEKLQKKVTFNEAFKKIDDNVFFDIVKKNYRCLF